MIADLPRQAPAEPATELVDSDAFADHESEAFLHALFRLYYRPIYYLFLSRGLSPQDGDDLAQETFLRIFRGIRSFRHESSLEAWIFKIAANVLRLRFRHARAAKRYGDVISLDSGHDESEAPLHDKIEDETQSVNNPLYLLLQEEQRQHLFRTVTNLPNQMRRCALLRYDRGLKYREIAATLGLSIQTVKSHLFEVRERLKATLGGRPCGAAGGDEDA